MINYKETRELLLNRINLLSRDIDYQEEVSGEDVWRLYFEGTQGKFTIELNLEYTEFYHLPRHMIFDANEALYIDSVTYYFKNLIDSKDELLSNEKVINRNLKNDNDILDDGL